MQMPDKKSLHEQLMIAACIAMLLHGKAEAFRPLPYNSMYLTLAIVNETNDSKQNVKDGMTLKNPIRLGVGTGYITSQYRSYPESEGYSTVLLVDGIYWSWLPNGGIYWFGDIIRRPPPPPRDYARHTVDEWLDGKVKPPKAEPSPPYVFALKPGEHTIRAVTLDIEGNLAEPRSLSNAISVTVE